MCVKFGEDCCWIVSCGTKTDIAIKDLDFMKSRLAMKIGHCKKSGMLTVTLNSSMNYCTTAFTTYS